MSRVSDAAERVEEYLRQFTKQTSVSTDVVHTVWTDPKAESAPLLTDDLVMLVECAQWLLMASSAELHREYCEATAEPVTDDDARIISRDLSVPERTAAEWNGSGIAPRAFVAQRLVSEWERRP